MVKNAFFCGSSNVVRSGLRGRIQRYKCNDCGRRFDGGIRRDKSQVISDYVEGKQTIEQLAEKYGVNEKTIRRDLEAMRYVHKIAKYKDVTIQMDTTYWGRNCALMKRHFPRCREIPGIYKKMYICETFATTLWLKI